MIKLIIQSITRDQTAVLCFQYIIELESQEKSQMARDVLDLNTSDQV
jgi:hypothetical protein